MCLSLRLQCLLLLNGGRQGDCVRVEFWLRETLLQRLLSPIASNSTSESSRSTFEFSWARQGPRRQSRHESTSLGESFFVVVLGASRTDGLAFVCPCSLVATRKRIPHGLHEGTHRIRAFFELRFT